MSIELHVERLVIDGVLRGERPDAVCLAIQPGLLSHGAMASLGGSHA